MKEYTQAVVTILALINPLVCTEIFTRIAGHLPRKDRIKEAVKATAAIGIVLFASSFFGMAILSAFGVSIIAFSCAGGGILVWIGASMLIPKSNDTTNIPSTEHKSVSLTPLILFAASPGTITAVITIAAAHNKQFLPVTAITGVAVSLVVLGAALLLAAKFSKGERRRTGMQKMISSYMGVLIIAMGIQFMLTGISKFINK
ncbi:MarC family protein [Desulfovibrio inopinatus]|uniref:MarC family protein n=1 Tax=Desulfovibrio inopinatus TaxID=102109 RepID=UPI0004001AB6|nr:MarC family protein [Desulfovibrio inopinatus]